jgi:CheY-specific phosphatase CheX
MAPEEITSEDMCDGIGELVNMVSGRAKTSLSEDSGSLYRLSLPSIIKGPGHEIGGRPKNCPFLFLVFEAEGHSFILQVTFRHF